MGVEVQTSSAGFCSHKTLTRPRGVEADREEGSGSRWSPSPRGRSWLPMVLLLPTSKAGMPLGLMMKKIPRESRNRDDPKPSSPRTRRSTTTMTAPMPGAGVMMMRLSRRSRKKRQTSPSMSSLLGSPKRKMIHQRHGGGVITMRARREPWILRHHPHHPFRGSTAAATENQTRELTLKETYHISSMPEPVLALIFAILEDGATLTRDDYANSPVVTASLLDSSAFRRWPSPCLERYLLITIPWI